MRQNNLPNTKECDQTLTQKIKNMGQKKNSHRKTHA